MLGAPPGAHRGPGFDSRPDRIDALQRPRQTRAQLREPRVLSGEFILIFVRVIMGNSTDDVFLFADGFKEIRSLRGGQVSLFYFPYGQLV